jgi:hypothetical protein
MTENKLGLYIEFSCFWLIQHFNRKRDTSDKIPYSISLLCYVLFFVMPNKKPLNTSILKG